MNKRATLLPTLVTLSLMFAATAAVAAQDGEGGHGVDDGVAVDAVDDGEGVDGVDGVDAVDAVGAGVAVENVADSENPALSAAAKVAPSSSSPGSWVVRVEGSLVAMRDNWLSLPGPEVGLTVGRDLNRSLSIELTGSAREVDNENRRSWSALAAARWVAISSTNGRHGLTVAAGPFVEVNHVVHGTMPFAHGELAYVYRAPFGLTVLAGFGPNIALANSSYVAPPRTSCDSSGDAFVFCLDLGPDAQEIHVGDAIGQMRLAVGWQLKAKAQPHQGWRDVTRRS